MGDLCPRCGVPSKTGRGPCEVCDYVFIAAVVVVASAATGRNQQIRISTRFGRNVLKRIGGEEAVYASDPQFDLIKDTESGHWLLCHHDTARNPTFYNGRAVGPDPVPIETGGRISIGPERLKLTVTLES